MQFKLFCFEEKNYCLIKKEKKLNQIPQLSSKTQGPHLTQFCPTPTTQIPCELLWKMLLVAVV